MAAIYLEGILKRMESTEAKMKHKSDSSPGVIPWDVLEQNLGMLDFGLNYEKELSRQEAIFLRAWAIKIYSLVQSPGNSADDVGLRDEVQIANEVEEYSLKLLEALEQSLHLFSAASTPRNESTPSSATQTPTRGKDDHEQPGDALPPFDISLHTWCKADWAARQCLARHLRLPGWVITDKGSTAVTILQDTQATLSIMSEEKANRCNADIQPLGEKLSLRTAKGELVVNRAALIRMRFPCLPGGVRIMFYIPDELPNKGAQTFLGALECFVLGHLFNDCQKCERRRPAIVKNDRVSTSKPAQVAAPQSH